MKKEDRNGPEDHRRWCSLPEPYPEPKVLAPNPYYAMLLLENYTGAVSELTAVHQYFYHHLTFDEQYEDIAELEECISIIEMHHLELLGETIALLGVTPKLRTITDNRSTYWTTAYVYYGEDVCDRLAADIAAEKSAIEQYRHHLQLIDDPYIKRLLERLIRDEQHHLKLFREAYARYCPTYEYGKD